MEETKDVSEDEYESVEEIWENEKHEAVEEEKIEEKKVEEMDPMIK